MRQSSFRKIIAVTLSVLILGSIARAATPTTPPYKVTHTVILGAPDRWDYVAFDSSSQRVFVAHGDRVTVVDGKDGAILGQVEGFPGGTHGIAISTSTGRGYTDDGKAGEAASFDLKTLKAMKRIKAEEDADGIVLDPSSGHVFVLDGDSGKVTVIDPKTDAVIATIDAGGKLEFGVAPGNGKLYVNGAEKKEIIRIDTNTNQVDARWSITSCTSPHGLAIDSVTHRLFSSCINNVLVVVNIDTGALVSSLPIGSGSDAVAFDPKRKLIFSTNGRDGTVSVLQEKDAQTFVSLGSFKTMLSARTMDIDPANGRLYIAGAEVDTKSAPVNGRPRFIPGSLKLLFLDPMQ